MMRFGLFEMMMMMMIIIIILIIVIIIIVIIIIAIVIHIVIIFNYYLLVLIIIYLFIYLFIIIIIYYLLFIIIIIFLLLVVLLLLSFIVIYYYYYLYIIIIIDYAHYYYHYVYHYDYHYSINIVIILLMLMLMLMLMFMLKMLIIKAEDHKARAGDILHIRLIIFLHRLVPCFIIILFHASLPLKSFQRPRAATQNYSNKKTWWKQFCTFRMITGWPFLTCHHAWNDWAPQGCCSRGATRGEAGRSSATVGHVKFVEPERSGD